MRSELVVSASCSLAELEREYCHECGLHHDRFAGSALYSTSQLCHRPLYWLEAGEANPCAVADLHTSAHNPLLASGWVLMIRLSRILSM